jgi:hypothetical protein
MLYDGFASMKPAHPRNHAYLTLYTDDGLYEAELYKWEFLRRNPQYRVDYDKFMGCFGTWLKSKGSWPHDASHRANWTKSDRVYFRTKIKPVLTALCRKWQVSDLFPPEFGEKEMFRAEANDEPLPPYPPTKSPRHLDRDFPSTCELQSMGFEGTRTNTKRCEHLLLLQVDLNSPMKHLLAHTKQELRLAQQDYRNEMESQGVRLPKGRRRFEDYDLHLRIWDLKQKGKSNTQIAKRVFPNLPAQSALTRVRDRLKAARKLISGHYKEIR